MGLIDFIFIICLYELFPNQNEKVLKEALAGSNSDAMETTLRCLRYFKMSLSLLQVLQKSLPIFL